MQRNLALRFSRQTKSVSHTPVMTDEELRGLEEELVPQVIDRMQGLPEKTQRQTVNRLRNAFALYRAFAHLHRKSREEI